MKFEIKIERKDSEIIITGNLPIFIRKAEVNFIAYCPKLKVSGFSIASRERAIADFSVNLDEFFRIHLERGTLEYALETFGWRKSDQDSHSFGSVELPTNFMGAELRSFEVSENLQIAA